MNTTISPVLAPVIPEEEPVLDIPRRIRIWAARRPAHIALIEGETTLTAAEFSKRMDCIATALEDVGLRTGNVIATLAGATADHVLLYMGAAALGVAVAPLPTSAHPDALVRMVENSAADVLFVDDTSAMPAAIGQARDLSEFVRAALSHAPAAPREIVPDQLFDIIYSSGTTGTPKGIEHDVRFRDMQVNRFRNFALDENSVTLFSTPLYSNTTLATLIPAMALGGTAILMRKFEEKVFLELSERHGVTHSMMVPAQIRRLIEFAEFDRYDLSAYIAKLSTSAPLPPAIVSKVLEKWPGRMINVYGMTEGGMSAVLDCSAFPDKWHTVGKAGGGATIRIIDEEGHVLPQGEIGEAVGRSTTMMRGYRKAPEATSEAIWTSPQGEVFIRSGDMGRLDEDGFLTLLDRRKDMIISGGFNIFAADLEAVVDEHPDVRDVAVIGVPSDRWGETPVACVVMQSGATTTPDDLLSFSNARLGRMQRLAEVRIFDELPRSPIGKVLKRELRDGWG